MKSGLSTGRDPPVRLRRVRRAGHGAAARRGVKRGYLRFDAGEDRTVTLRLATSLISVDQAKDNLRQEIPDGTSFETVQGPGAGSSGTSILGKVEVEGATPDQLTTLYSSLYRLYLYPNSGFEKVGAKYQYASPVLADDRPGHPDPHRREDRRRQGVRQQRLLGHLPDDLARVLAS